MKKPFDIADLVADLEPVKPLNRRAALVAPIFLTMAAVAIIAFAAGLRTDLLAGRAASDVFAARRYIAFAGLVTGTTLLGMANPESGDRVRAGKRL